MRNDQEIKDLFESLQRRSNNPTQAINLITQILLLTKMNYEIIVLEESEKKEREMGFFYLKFSSFQFSSTQHGRLNDSILILIQSLNSYHHL